MSSFEFNKISAALLVALIIGMISSFVAEGLVSPKKLEKSVYNVPGVQATSAEAAPAKEEIPDPKPFFAKASADDGARIAKACMTCHTFDKGGPNRVGPNLWGIIDDKRAHAQGFSYSSTIANMGGAWTPEEINKFIANPRTYAPGTKMSFVGLSKPQERADVIAYLDKMTDKPVDLSK